MLQFLCYHNKLQFFSHNVAVDDKTLSPTNTNVLNKKNVDFNEGDVLDWAEQIGASSAHVNYGTKRSVFVT